MFGSGNQRGILSFKTEGLLCSRYLPGFHKRPCLPFSFDLTHPVSVSRAPVQAEFIIQNPKHDKASSKDIESAF